MKMFFFYSLGQNLLLTNAINLDLFKDFLSITQSTVEASTLLSNKMLKHKINKIRTVHLTKKLSEFKNKFKEIVKRFEILKKWL